MDFYNVTLLCNSGYGCRRCRRLRGFWAVAAVVPAALVLSLALTRTPAAAQGPSPTPAGDSLTQAQAQTPHRARLLALMLGAKQASAGDTVSVTVALTRPAPAGGVTVALKSSNLRLFPLPRKVTIPAGMRSLELSVIAAPSLPGAGPAAVAAGRKPSEAQVEVTASEASATAAGGKSAAVASKQQQQQSSVLTRRASLVIRAKS